MPCTWIGIDPGESGAVAMLDTLTDGLHVDAMPMKNLTRRDLIEWLEPFGARGDVAAHVERVGAMPGQGVASTFKFGMAYERCLMALTAAGIPFEQVAPHKWMVAMASPLPKDKPERKRHLKARAQELFPSMRVTLATADALLIAEHCRRTWR